MRIKILLIFAACFICLNIYADNYKRYPFKSGRVEYALSGNTQGIQVLYWDNYGYNELLVEKSQTEIMGQKSLSYKSTLTQGNDVYTWSDDDDKIYLVKTSLNDKWNRNNYSDDDIEIFLTEIFKEAGYEKNRTEILLGKKCDVYEGLGELWIWKGIKLKTEIRLFGTYNQVIAVDINLSWDAQSSIFAVPSGYRMVNIENVDEEIDQKSYSEDGALDSVEIQKMLEGLFEKEE